MVHMALGMAWMFVLGILCAAGARDVSGAVIRSCIIPHVLKDRDTLQPYDPDVSANYVCPPNYRQFGDDCFHPVEYGQHYRPVVVVSFATAQQTCQEQGAEVVSLLDLRDPDVLQAVVEIPKEHILRDLLMFDQSSCVERSDSSSVWGEQLCVKRCSEALQKMIICRRPADPVQN